MYNIFSLRLVGISSCIVSNQAKMVKLCMTIYASYVEVSDFDVSLGFFAGETWHWNKTNKCSSKQK